MFPFDKYCLNQEKSQAAEMSLCGTGDTAKAVFKSLSAKGKRLVP